MDLGLVLSTLVLWLMSLVIFGFIIIKHHSKKQSPILVTENYNLQKSLIIYVLSWIIIIFSTLVLIGFVFPLTSLVDMVAAVGIFLLPILFILIIIGIIYYGAALVITGNGYFYPGSRYFLPVKGGGSFFSRTLTRMWGLVFAFGGTLLLLLFSSFVCNLIIKSKIGVCTGVDLILETLQANGLEKIGTGVIPVLGLISFIYWVIHKFNRNL